MSSLCGDTHFDECELKISKTHQDGLSKNSDNLNVILEEYHQFDSIETFYSPPRGRRNTNFKKQGLCSNKGIYVNNVLIYI